MMGELEFHKKENNTLLGDCFHIFEDHRLTNTQRYCQLAILVFCCLFISSANFLQIIGLINTNKTLSLSKKLFLYLSVSDLLTGVVAVPYQLLMVFVASNATCFMIHLQSFLVTFTPAITMFTILSISIARYLSAVKPNFFRRNANSRLIVVLMIVQALLALGIAIWFATATSVIQLGTFLISVTFFCFSLIGVSIILNVCLYYKMFKRSIERSATKQCQNQEYHKEVIKTLIIISFILSICYLPNGIVFAVVGYYVLANDPRQTMYNDYVPWVYLPIVLNGGLNSYVYMWRDKKILNYYLRYMRRRLNNETSLPTSNDV